MKRLASFAFVAVTLLSGSPARADDPYAEARESVLAFFSAIREGDVDLLERSVHGENDSSKSMSYQAFRKAAEIRSDMRDVTAALSRHGFELDSTTILRRMPIFNFVLDPKFLGQIKSSRVFIDQSGAAALAEIEYEEAPVIIESKKSGERWVVVLSERHDKMFRGEGLLALTEILAARIEEARDAVERGDFHDAAMILENIGQGRLSPLGEGEGKPGPSNKSADRLGR